MNAILKNSQFAMNAGQWDIVLLGTEIDDVARNRIAQEHKASGQLWEQGGDNGPRAASFYASGARSSRRISADLGSSACC